jgi:tryptophan-rich sensory protein
MIALTAATTILFARIRRTAALLMLPYLAWLCFAPCSTTRSARFNPNAENLVPGGGGTDIISEQIRGTSPCNPKTDSSTISPRC